MELRSLGYRSQLIFTAFDGMALDRGDHWAIHTLSNPNFFWGNLLIFDRPPRQGDFAVWTQTFKSEFTNPKIHHITLAWDSADGTIGEIDEFIENGFTLEATAVLSASNVNRPLKYNSELVVRGLQTESEWEEMIRVQVASSHDNLPPSEWERFYRTQALRYQAMDRAGFGQWYGGFLNGQLAGGLGLFHHQRVGRFQSVSTAPDFQRRGVCQTLVYEASRRLLDSGTVDHLVMCADPDYHAIKIYEAVGFERQITEHGVYWWDKNHHS